MNEELGGLLYPSERSAMEDRLWVCITAALDRLAKSSDAIDQCVSIALKTEASVWEKAIRAGRRSENQVDRDMDEQQ